MESLTANLFVKDIIKSVDFYKSLGFNTVMTVPENENFVWAMMSNGSVTIMLQSLESLGEELPVISRQGGGSLLLYIKIKNIRSFFESVKDNVNVVKGLEKTFYGATEFSITDCDNFLLTFAEDE